MANERRRMGGPRGGQMPVEKAKDFKGSIGKLFVYMKKYHAAVVVVILCAVASTLFSVIGPDILGKATTELANGLMAKIQGTGGIDFTKIGQILLFVLGLYLLSTLFNFVQGWLMTGVTQKVCYRMRKDISEKIDRMPMAYFESRTYGEVLSRITNDVDTLGQSLNQSITQIITSVATMVGALVMMLRISPLMTLIAVIILPISVTLISLVVKKSQKYFKQQQEYLGHINGQVEESYAGQTVIQAYNKEKDTVRQFQETNDTLYHSAWKSQFLSGLMQPIMMFVGNLGYAAVALSGGLLAIRGTITIGDIQAFIQYVKNFTQPMQQIAQVLNQVQSMAAATERVFEFLEEDEEVQTAEHPVQLADVRGSVDFEHVSFGYKPEQCIIHDFSAKVHPGQKVAIVGPTGAGKTTMVKLLMRFYDVNSGSIKLDGGHRRRKGSPRRYLYPPAAGRLSDGAERGRQQRVTGTETAAYHCTCDSGRQPGHDPGRGDFFRRYPNRNSDPEGNGSSDGGQDQLYHCAPPFHHPQCGYDPGHEGRRHHRAGYAR